jgi:hypothetical protein
MTPKQLMTLGISAAVVAAMAEYAAPQSAVVMLFAAGALFGKGYGIWEERERRKRTAT